MTTMAAMNTVDTASFQVSFISGTSSERAKTPASNSPPGAIPARVQGQHGAEKGPGLLPGGQVLGSWQMTLLRSSAGCHGSVASDAGRYLRRIAAVKDRAAARHLRVQALGRRHEDRA